jgi:hypothetical protein
MSMRLLQGARCQASPSVSASHHCGAAGKQAPPRPDSSLTYMEAYTSVFAYITRLHCSLIHHLHPSLLATPPCFIF